MKNLENEIPVSPIPVTRIHKNHPQEQIIGNVISIVQTRRTTKDVKEQGIFARSPKQRNNHKDLQNCLFACFLSHLEPKNTLKALQDPSSGGGYAKGAFAIQATRSLNSD